MMSYLRKLFGAPCPSRLAGSCPASGVVMPGDIFRVGREEKTISAKVICLRRAKARAQAPKHRRQREGTTRPSAARPWQAKTRPPPVSFGRHQSRRSRLHAPEFVNGDTIGRLIGD